SLGTPAPPQLSPFGQGKSVVQSMRPPFTSTPQPFETKPHLPAHAVAAAMGVQVGGAPHFWGPPKPHTSPLSQPPVSMSQSMVPPQPLPMVPHSASTSAQLGIWAGQSSSPPSGGVPQMNGSSRPHTSPRLQLPQSYVPPQPSPSVPHSLPSHASACEI